MMKSKFSISKVIVIDKFNKVLLLKRNTKKLFGGNWEIPGGKIETPETAYAAALRELSEEIGRKIAPITSIGKLTVPDRIDPGFSIPIYLFTCKGESDILVLEHDEYVWLEYPKLSKLNLVHADKKILDDYYHAASAIISKIM